MSNIDCEIIEPETNEIEVNIDLIVKNVFQLSFKRYHRLNKWFIWMTDEEEVVFKAVTSGVR